MLLVRMRTALIAAKVRALRLVSSAEDARAAPRARPSLKAAR
jgi:hypothetical protein